MEWLVLAVSAVIGMAAAMYRWRCPQCRRYQAVKGRLVYTGSGLMRRSNRSYSCANCNHKWTTNGTF